MFASNSDIQTWLADDKIPVTDGLAAKPNIDAERTIRGQLVGIFTPLVLSGWDSPGNTPELIRSIAGRLSAAYIYRKIFAEQGTDVPAYAQELYNEALAMLVQIQTGDLTVVDDDGVAIGESGSILGFWPDDSVAPAFTMDQRFS